MALNLREVFKDVPPGARKFGVVGWPLSHTLSPAMHAAAYGALKLDAVYRAIPVPPAEWKDFISQAEDLPLDGFNITVPHKEMVLAEGNHPLPWDAERCLAVGAVNTVRRNGGHWTAFNTDVAGLQDDLRAQGVSTGGRNAVLVGAGGAARAAVSALIGLPHPPRRVWILNRTLEKAQDVIRGFSGGAAALEAAELAQAPRLCREATLLVNATSVGLADGDPSPVDPAGFHGGLAVYDMIYHRDTALLKAARAAGAQAINGLGMLAHQGARAFEIWFNKRPPVDVMRRAALEELKTRSVT